MFLTLISDQMKFLSGLKPAGYADRMSMALTEAPEEGFLLLIMGHEASGIIEATGSAVKKWKQGDRVTFDSTVYPLDDWFTLEGRYNLSDNREVLGVSPGDYRRNGAFAELLAVPQHILYRIPDSVTFEQAAMVEAAAVALHAVNISGDEGW